MAIDRAARARRRHELRRAHARGGAEAAPAVAAAAMEIDGLFNPGRKHQLEYLESVAISREDERESGAGALDLDAGVARLVRQPDGPA